MGYVQTLEEFGIIEYPFTDFSGGLNTKASKALGVPDSQFGLKSNQLVTLFNWEFEDSGGLVIRPGYAKFLDTGLGAGKEIHTIYEFVLKSGTRYLIVGEGKNLYLYNSGTNTLDLKYVSLTVAPWVFTTFNDLAIGVNGSDPPVKFNGTIWANLTDTALTGTVTKNGTTAIVGVGTAFTSEVSVGDYLNIPGGGATEILLVATVTDNTNIVLGTAAVYSAGGESGRVFENSKSAPKTSKTIVEHRNRLWAIDSLNLVHCALSAPNDWTTSNNAGTIPIPISGKSSKGTFLVAMYDRLIIGLDSSLAVLTGTSPATGDLSGTEHLYRLDPVNSYQGGIEQRSVVKVVNDVHYLSRRGIHSMQATEAQELFGDVNQLYVSALIEPTFQGSESGRLDKIFALNLRSKNQIFWVRTLNGGSANTEALVYDYYHGAWTIFRPFPFSSGAEVRVGDEDVALFGGYDGEIYQYDSGQLDNGATINAEGVYLTALGDISLIKSYRWAGLIVGASATTTYNIQPTFDFGTKVGATVPLQVAASAQVLPLVLPFILTDPTSSNKLVTVPIPGSGVYLELRFTHSDSGKTAAFRGGTIYAEPRRSIYA